MSSNRSLAPSLTEKVEYAAGPFSGGLLGEGLAVGELLEGVL